MISYLHKKGFALETITLDQILIESRSNIRITNIAQ